jgi:hypothetical protein
MPRRIIPMPLGIKHRPQTPEPISSAIVPITRKTVPAVLAPLVLIIGGPISFPPFLNPDIWKYSNKESA